ncbi:MAG: isocitrate lyase/phosphoenolpyruvate mutase family protein [Planctomycetota bacterium]
MSTHATHLPGNRLRTLMNEGCVGLPGAYNGLVARQAATIGFDGLYVSGAAVTASFGVPDIGMLSLTEFCNVIYQVTVASGLPVLCDADTGFGESEITRRAVAEYHRAGAAGFHIEDQVFPKRCGHLDGKTLVSIDHFQEKVAAAASARDDLTDGSFVVCARTDAYGVDGMDATIERAKAYVDAGADMLFPDGMRTESDYATFAEALRNYTGGSSRREPYLLAIMTEFGKTEMISLDRFAELGYHCVIWPVSSLRITMHAVREGLQAIRDAGSPEPVLERMQTRKDLYELLRYTPGQEWSFPSAIDKG